MRYSASYPDDRNLKNLSVHFANVLVNMLLSFRRLFNVGAMLIQKYMVMDKAASNPDNIEFWKTYKIRWTKGRPLISSYECKQFFLCRGIDVRDLV